MFRTLLASIDRLAVGAAPDDPYRQAQVRALFGTNYVLVATFALAAVFAVASRSLSGWEWRFAVIVLTPAVLLNASIPRLVYLTGHIGLGQQLTLMSTFAVAVSGIFVNGGPLQAPSTQTLLLQPVMAFFLLGSRGGHLWAGIVALAVSVLYAMDFSGFAFPDLQPQAVIQAGELFNFAVSFVALVILFTLSNANRRQLEQLLDIERDRYRHMAMHDNLTALANREHFEQMLAEAVRNSAATAAKVALLYVDLNDFKPLNDRFGHDFGDEVLRIVGARMRSIVRASDTVARLGGDEFAVLMGSVTDTSSLQRTAELVHSQVSRPMHVNEHLVSVSVSVGICVYPDQADSAKALWVGADRAMYIAKRGGKPWHWQGDA